MGNILLLEDDKSLNRGISFKLKKEGYNVCTAFNIKEAKDVFENNKVDLIISDVGLPDGSGFDFCEEKKSTRCAAQPLGQRMEISYLAEQESVGRLYRWAFGDFGESSGV